MKQLIIGFVGVAAFIIFVGVITNKTQGPSTTPVPQGDLTEIKIGEKSVFVEVADSEEERRMGLSKRSSLGTDNGMLFIFKSKDTFPSFWMKDMLISLDIIWIDNDKIVKIDKNVPFPKAGTPDTELTLYRPDKPIDYVLEINAGFSDINNIVVGDSVDLTGL